MSMVSGLKCHKCKAPLEECECPIDTSDIPEVSDEFFKNAKVRVSTPGGSMWPTESKALNMQVAGRWEGNDFVPLPSLVTGRSASKLPTESNPPKTKPLTEEEMLNFKFKVVARVRQISGNGKSSVLLNQLLGMQRKALVKWVEEEFEKIPEDQRFTVGEG